MLLRASASNRTVQHRLRGSECWQCHSWSVDFILNIIYIYIYHCFIVTGATAPNHIVLHFQAERDGEQRCGVVWYAWSCSSSCSISTTWIILNSGHNDTQSVCCSECIVRLATLMRRSVSQAVSSRFVTSFAFGRFSKPFFLLSGRGCPNSNCLCLRIWLHHWAESFAPKLAYTWNWLCSRLPEIFGPAYAVPDMHALIWSPSPSSCSLSYCHSIRFAHTRSRFCAFF